jgi:hypothetical protein
MPDVWTNSAGGPVAHEHKIPDVEYIRHGTAAPNAASGVAAPVGALYSRDNAGIGELWLKTGAGDTAWTKQTTP